MARDIEEFLRRAAERRQKQLKQKQAGIKRPAAPQPVRTVQPPQRLVISDEAVEVVRKQPDMRSESVTQHVSRHLDTTSVIEHSTHLAESLEHTDERMEERLHAKFDHSLSTLQRKSTVQDDVTPIAEGAAVSRLASELIDMMRSPKNARQAIIISEVLKRPDFD